MSRTPDPCREDRNIPTPPAAREGNADTRETKEKIAQLYGDNGRKVTRFIRLT